MPTAVVDRTRLNQTSGSNLVDAIAHTPGVAQITTGAAISKPMVRGLGYNRVITLNNGARQEGQQWGDEHGIEIDAFSVDRAEIIKGPGSLLYGSDAMAGVINFVAPDPIAEGRIKGTATTNYQTNNHLQAYSFENSGFNEWDANGYVGLNKSWGYSHLSFSTFNQRLGLTARARDPRTRQFLKEVPSGDSTLSVPVTAGDLRGYGLAVPQQ